MDHKRRQVFLSYNTTDKAAVEELARRLVENGIEPWFDTWNLIPGDPWQPALEAALRLCKTCAVFIGPGGIGPWQHEEMRVAIDQRVKEGGFRVVPVLLPGAKREERSTLPSFLVAATWVEFRQRLDDQDAFRRLLSGIRGLAPGPGPSRALYEGECPYRGLETFNIDHAQFFFGRRALTEWLLNKLRPAGTEEEYRFLAIIGPSGSGKSSLARAGLLAALKRGEQQGSESWPLVVCRPGANPLENLAVALSGPFGYERDANALAELIKGFEQRNNHLHLAVSLALKEAGNSSRLVILIDQFEELYTLGSTEPSRQAFIENLLYATTVLHGKTVAILTLRADFYGECTKHPRLAAAVSDHQLLIPTMLDEELRAAIEEPAQLVGLELEPGLPELLIGDVKQQPGILPLLQHALLELWNRRDGRRLTHAGYKAIGGIEGALEQRAEDIFLKLSDQEKDVCQKLFLRLTQVSKEGKDTKRRVNIEELTGVIASRHSLDLVLQKLSSPDARLITVSGDLHQTQVELSHEALIGGWKRLQRWLDENREFLLWRQRLRSDVERWVSEQRKQPLLLHEEELDEVAKWQEWPQADINEVERSFIQQSRAQIQKKRRLSSLTWAAVGCVLLGLLAYVSYTTLQAKEEGRRALISKATGIVEYTPKANDFLPRLSKYISDAQYEIWFTGISFYLSLPQHRDLLLKKLQEGVDVRFLVYDPLSANIEEVANGFSQTKAELLSECVRTVEALKGMYEMSKSQNPPGKFEVRLFSTIPRTRMYVFDRQVETGFTYFIPHVDRQNTPNLPGFLVQNIKTGIAPAYFEGIERTWNSSKRFEEWISSYDRHAKE